MSEGFLSRWWPTLVVFCVLVVFLWCCWAGQCIPFFKNIPDCSFETSEMIFRFLFYLFQLSRNNEGKGFTWPWKCLAVNYPITFEPLKIGPVFKYVCNSYFKGFNNTSVEPLELKLKVWTSITSWLSDIKSAVVVYRGKLKYLSFCEYLWTQL